MRKGLFCAFALCFLFATSPSYAENTDKADRAFERQYTNKKVKISNTMKKIRKSLYKLHKKHKRAFCSGDFNMDRKVDDGDAHFIRFCNSFDSNGKFFIGICRLADLNDDYKVDILDLAKLSTQLEAPENDKCTAKVGPNFHIVGEDRIP